MRASGSTGRLQSHDTPAPYCYTYAANLSDENIKPKKLTLRFNLKFFRPCNILIDCLRWPRAFSGRLQVAAEVESSWSSLLVTCLESDR